MNEKISTPLEQQKIQSHITYENLLEIYDLIAKSQIFHYQNLLHALPKSLQCSTDTLKGRVSFLKKQRKKLRGSDLNEFLNRQFSLPVLTATSISTLHRSTESKTKKVEELRRKLPNIKTDSELNNTPEKANSL